MPLNLDNFIKYHVKARNSLHNKSLKYDEKELLELCEMMIKLLETEEPVAKMSPPCTVVGDIHGQFNDLLRVFSCITETKGVCGAFQDNFVYLGDYVDRGRHSLECVCLLFALKCRFPKQFVLLRGNHEVRNINRDYGFWDEMCDRFGLESGEKLWEAFNQVFAWLPLVCLIGKKILCMHGGLSEQLTLSPRNDANKEIRRTLDDVIKEIPRPLDDVNKNQLAVDLLWSDPLSNLNGFKPNTVRGVGHFFGEDVVLKALKDFDLGLIVRAHQVMTTGFAFFAKRNLVTIFTAPRYQADLANAGAILRVTAGGCVHFVVLKPHLEDGPPTQAEVSSSCFAGKEEEGEKKMDKERKRRSEEKKKEKKKKKKEAGKKNTQFSASKSATSNNGG